MNILVVASTMQVSKCERSNEKPSLKLKAARLLGNICVLSLDLLCVARLIPSPSQRTVWYVGGTKPAGCKAKTGDTNNNMARSINNCKAALNMQGDLERMATRPSERGLRRRNFYTETNYNILNEGKILNTEGAGNYVGLQNMGITINMDQGGDFNKFMLDILYHNKAIVEIMTPQEFKEYCTNLFKQKTQGN